MLTEEVPKCYATFQVNADGLIKSLTTQQRHTDEDHAEDIINVTPVAARASAPEDVASASAALNG